MFRLAFSVLGVKSWKGGTLLSRLLRLLEPNQKCVLQEVFAVAVVQDLCVKRATCLCSNRKEVHQVADIMFLRRLDHHHPLTTQAGGVQG